MPQAVMKNKIAIVTDANSGIGKMTALGLAQAGATVVMACRDLARSSSALAEVRARSGSGQVHLLQLDLASQASVHAFVREFTRGFDRLDVLVSNAGIASRERKVTADGYELNFAVHHLGPFLLTTLLLPVLERSAPSRVIVVAGSAQRYATIDWDDLQSEKKYSMVRASGQSRLANLLFVRALAEHAHGVTANALDPGITATDITRELPAPVRALTRLFVQSPEKGARTSIYLATSPAVTNVTGKYFKNAREYKSNPLARDDEAARRLWQISERLTATTTQEKS